MEQKGESKALTAEVWVPPEPAKGLPTLGRLQEALVAKGFEMSPGGSLPGYVVDEVRHNLFRVRWNEFEGVNRLEKLTAAQEALSDYATMITVGSGSYRDPMEILVAPKPGTENARLSYSDPPPRGALVEQALVREDVWQALLKGTVDRGWRSTGDTIEDYRKGIRGYLAWRKAEQDKLVAAIENDPSPTRLLLSELAQERRHPPEQFPGAWFFGRDDSRFTMGFSEHWDILEDMGPIPEHMIDVAAEFAFISAKMLTFRQFWRPSYYAGQETEWPRFREHFRNLLEVVEVQAKEWEEEMREWEEGEEPADEDEGEDEDGVDEECDDAASSGP